jgi:hypothetical protein
MSGSTKLMTAGGGGVNITPASSVSSDVTVQVPSQNCTLGIQGPAFSAYQNSSQTITNNTWTKVQLQIEEFDTANSFDSSTNYRFTPTIAGYYQINGATNLTNILLVSIYKNGAEYKRGQQATLSQANVSSLLYMNGSTDYIEMYCYMGGTGTNPTGTGIQYTYFNGALVRAA